MNIISSQIGDCFKNGDVDKANNLKKETTDLKDQIKSLKNTFNSFDNLIKELLYQIPNLPHDLVPPGKTDEDNQIIYSAETKNLMNSDFLPHWDLCSKYNLIDFELGVKITGAGFPVYKGKGAILQRALIQFFFK